MYANYFLQLLFFIVFSILLSMVGWNVYTSALSYENKNEEFVEKLHAMPSTKRFLKGHAEKALKWIVDYSGYSKEIKILEELQEEINSYHRNNIFMTLGFVILGAIFIILVYILDRNNQLFILAMLLTSFIALVVGLVAPILMIIAYMDIPVLGQVAVQFQSKSIISSIQTLYNSGNLFVAIIILLFSVIIPLLKTVIMGVALFTNYRSHIIKWIVQLGKWSMTDVLIVSLFLVVFTLNEDEITDAKLQIGVYFFFCYVILSIAASLLLMASGDSCGNGQDRSGFSRRNRSRRQPRQQSKRQFCATRKWY